MIVGQMMSTPVIITQRNVKLNYLMNQFAKKAINAVPVLEDDGSISGIVSTADVMRKEEEDMIVQDIMSDRIHIVMKNNRLIDAARIMVKHDVHHLVVMDNGQVVGMISSMDIVKVFAEME